MRKRLMHNWKLKLLSLAGAIMLWLVVVSISNPVQTRTFTGVPVEVINSSAITSEGKVYEILDNSNLITIEVTARRNIQLSRDDFKAVANMQDIQLMKYIPITITCTKTVDIQEIKTKTPNLKISIEDSDTKTLPIVVRTTGTPGDGYIVDNVNTIASPESVRITGAASAIKKISRAFAEVDVSGITMDTDRITSLSLYDSDGDPIKNSYLSYNIDTSKIDVSVKLLKTKEVPIRVEVSGNVASGYRYTTIHSEPGVITLAGEEEVLKNIVAIQIPASQIDISGAIEDVEKVIDITAYLPEGTQLAEQEEASVAVNVKVEKLEEGTITLAKEAIQLEHVPQGYHVEFLSAAELIVPIRALKKHMEALDPAKWKASVDLTEYKKAGTYEVPVKLQTQDGFELIDEPIVVIRLEKEQ